MSEKIYLKDLDQFDLDNLADVIWWLKGYYAGANNTFNDCPFVEDHLKSLKKIIINIKQTKGNEDEKSRQNI